MEPHEDARVQNAHRHRVHADSRRARLLPGRVPGACGALDAAKGLLHLSAPRGACDLPTDGKREKRVRKVRERCLLLWRLQCHRDQRTDTGGNNVAQKARRPRRVDARVEQRACPLPGHPEDVQDDRGRTGAHGFPQRVSSTINEGGRPVRRWGRGCESSVQLSVRTW